MNAIQTGPNYHCFACDAPVTLLTNFRPCGSELDAWSGHIWYLRKACKCQPVRVIRLGDCITPLNPAKPDGLSPADIPAIRAGLEAIARAVPPEERCVDPATRIVHGLLAGTLSPEQAIGQIRGMVPTMRPHQAAEMILG